MQTRNAPGALHRRLVMRTRPRAPRSAQGRCVTLHLTERRTPRGCARREMPAATAQSKEDYRMNERDRARQLAILLRGVKRCGAALFEIADCENPGAKFRERATVGQCPAAHLLRRLFFAAGLDFAPVVLRIPLPIRPM